MAYFHLQYSPWNPFALNKARACETEDRLSLYGF